jgi:hypothetical protein
MRAAFAGDYTRVVTDDAKWNYSKYVSRETVVKVDYNLHRIYNEVKLVRN